MIGGTDYVIDGRPSRDAHRVLRLVLRTAWPEFVEQKEKNEIFFHRSPQDAGAWQRDGATPENVDTMLHVIFGSDSLTLVAAEDEMSTTRALAMGVIDRLNAPQRNSKKNSSDISVSVGVYASTLCNPARPEQGVLPEIHKSVIMSEGRQLRHHCLLCAVRSAAP